MCWHWGGEIYNLPHINVAIQLSAVLTIDTTAYWWNGMITEKQRTRGKNIDHYINGVHSPYVSSNSNTSSTLSWLLGASCGVNHWKCFLFESAPLCFQIKWVLLCLQTIWAAYGKPLWQASLPNNNKEKSITQLPCSIPLLTCQLCVCVHVKKNKKKQHTHTDYCVAISILFLSPPFALGRFIRSLL